MLSAAFVDDSSSAGYSESGYGSSTAGSAYSDNSNSTAASGYSDNSNATSATAYPDVSESGYTTASSGYSDNSSGSAYGDAQNNSGGADRGYPGSIPAAVAQPFSAPKKVDRDWNEEFQYYVSSYKAATDVRAKFDAAKNLEKLAQEFVDTATRLGRTIIDEREVAAALKTIKPQSVGGIAGGEKVRFATKKKKNSSHFFFPLAGILLFPHPVPYKDNLACPVFLFIVFCFCFFAVFFFFCCFVSFSLVWYAWFFICFAVPASFIAEFASFRSSRNDLRSISFVFFLGLVFFWVWIFFWVWFFCSGFGFGLVFFVFVFFFVFVIFC